MKRKGSVLGGLISIYARVIFLGLVLWGFALYMENEWVMIKWPW